MENRISISTKIFDELLLAVEVLGVEKTLKTLKEAKTNSLILDDFNIDFIINNVSIVTGTKRDRILYGNDRNDERKIALSLCVFFIKSEFGYTFSQLKTIFNKDESALCRYVTIIDNLPVNPKTDFDKRLTDFYKKMKLIITEKKLKNGK